MGILNNSPANFLENSLIYINQGYLTIKDNRKLFYAEYYLIGQSKECANPPEDIEIYVCADRQVKVYRPCYDPLTGNFFGLYETLEHNVVRGIQRSTCQIMSSVNRTRKSCTPIIRKGYRVCLAAHSLTAIKWCLRQGVYRPHFQMFFISYPPLPIGVRRKIGI